MNVPSSANQDYIQHGGRLHQREEISKLLTKLSFVTMLTNQLIKQC